jgi:TatD DNase family protein
VSYDNWQNVIALSQSHEHIYGAFGLHPCFMNKHEMTHLEQLDKMLKTTPTVAVGEFGLDAFVHNADLDIQMPYFDAQLQMAKSHSLPVILHVRKAHDQVLKALRGMNLHKGGVIHAFSGSEQQAYQYIDLGMKLGFGGAMTYDRAKKLRHLASTLPLDSIVLETDSPDMLPAFVPKERHNSPRYLPQIASHFSDLRVEEESVVYETLYNTTQEIFSLN